MASTLVKIDLDRISDWQSFHDVFSEALGFPDFYGRNMNAWIDCMTSVDEPADGLTSVHAPSGGFLVLQFENVADFAARCPELYEAIADCTAFVNFRRIEAGEEPVLGLSFWRRSGRR